MEHLADNFQTVVKSPCPGEVFCYSPGLALLPNGRLIATMDFGGPGVRDLPHAVRRNPHDTFWYAGRIFASDDRGETWQEKTQVSMLHMRPFVAGNALYAIGCSPDLRIIRSDDWGETWGELEYLTHEQIWHQAPSNVWYKDDCIYLVMERETDQCHGWPVCSIAPILMRGKITDDLTRRENWTFASELVFKENIDENNLPEFGIPFYPNIPGGYMAGTPMGWLETNVVQLLKPNDWFYDPTGKTLHLFMRTWTGATWMGAMIKVVEHDDGTMETMFEHAPSGKRMVFIPIPGGGSSKFHILYDEKTKTYWLLGSQFTDSMVNFNEMTYHQWRGYDRYRLALYYSINCFDWIPAGVVTAGKTPAQARSYASMVIDGDDLLVLSRTGDDHALSGHDTNIISFHRVKNFRSLIDL